MNKVVLIGRLTADAKYYPMEEQERGCIRFRLAVKKDYFNQKDGEDAYFISVAYWLRNGERLCQYLNKGKMVCVSGKIITKSFEGKDGTRKYITEIEAEDLQLLASSRKQAIG
jgi:single-strand DNA-binding protein